MVASDYPSLLPPYASRTPAGTGSVIDMPESRIAYLAQAARAPRDPGVPRMDVRPDPRPVHGAVPRVVHRSVHRAATR